MTAPACVCTTRVAAKPWLARQRLIVGKSSRNRSSASSAATTADFFGGVSIDFASGGEAVAETMQRHRHHQHNKDVRRAPVKPSREQQCAPTSTSTKTKSTQSSSVCCDFVCFCACRSLNRVSFKRVSLGSLLTGRLSLYYTLVRFAIVWGGFVVCLFVLFLFILFVPSFIPSAARSFRFHSISFLIPIVSFPFKSLNRLRP